MAAPRPEHAHATDRPATATLPPRPAHTTTGWRQDRRPVVSKRPLHSLAAAKMSPHIHIGPEPVLAAHARSPPAAGSRCPAGADSAPHSEQNFTLLSGLGLKHMRIRSHHDLAGTLVTPYSWEDHGGVLRLLPVYPSQCSLLQVTSTDVAFPPYCRSCPCDRHDLYLPSIPASLQTLGRCECAAACALAPLGLRIISPRTFYLSFLRAIWTFV